MPYVREMHAVYQRVTTNNRSAGRRITDPEVEASLGIELIGDKFDGASIFLSELFIRPGITDWERVDGGS